MAHDPSSASGTGMHLYGRTLYEYEGTGSLRYEDEEHTCRFLAGQIADGSVILLCKFEGSGPELFRAEIDVREPIGLTGETADGTQVTVSGHVQPINWLPDTSRSASSWSALRADKLHARFPGPQEVSEIRFGLTNLKFLGNRPHQEGRRWVQALPVAMEALGVEGDALVVPVAGYVRIAKRLGIVKGTDVTAELLIADSTMGPRQAELHQWVEDLCYVFSVARGTKVQWIYREERASDGAVAARVHANRVTKPYVGMPAIDYREPCETERFVATAMKEYAKRRNAWELNRGVIDSYLDARLEADHLEPRGLKMAGTIEKLKAVFLAQPDAGISEHVLDSEDFERLLAPHRDRIKQALQQAGVSDSDRESIASKEKVRSLNRRGFRSILNRLRETLGVTMSSSELQRFVQSRNKLVHEAEFYCQAATAEEREREPRPFSTPLEEFLFLVNFLDRIFLRLLGYSGTYMDWKERPPARAELRHEGKPLPR